MRTRATLPRFVIGGLAGIGLAGLGLTVPAFAGPGEGLSAYDQGDYGTAYRELAPAAAAGDALAQYTLARMYLSGVGVSRDPAEGFKWLRKAALAGVGAAQYQLGAHYEWGVDVGQDYAEAGRWYRMAADRGVAEAQYRLGLLYSDGHGVASDLVAAHMWLNLAAARLPPGEARNTVMKLRESVGAKLSATQIAEAHNAARDWTPVASH
jgi:TPR repeat protein